MPGKTHTSLQEFGGDWTHQKLHLLDKYLSAYTKILRNTRHRFAYIDAFAGTGYRVTSTGDDNPNLAIPEFINAEAHEFLDGSAQIALACSPPFQKFIFIERDLRKLSQLQELIRDKFPERQTDVSYKCGDANTEIRLLARADWTRHRAVLFLDPFGMQVEWATIAAIAKTRAIDLWILFPLGVAVNRMLTRSGEIPDSWRECLNRLFGCTDWFEAFYKAPKTQQLFGDAGQLEKVATFEAIGEYFIDRLKSIFPAVAHESALLRNSKGNPLYSLCFAAANERGGKPAVKIANDILRKFNNG